MGENRLAQEGPCEEQIQQQDPMGSTASFLQEYLTTK